ncbi:UDP-4-amino-4,6-dideoxy-N-acetyl-beta-L-altrosamine transaminase [Marinitoga aeolica]|uniref:UDP-4-amino-4, 6-dideoxy-N-acetyl-beta-L-altrosamine transaminase n=1 Tax=Marinitoga aeolica TaxID=2809031 RepID=A0ABY8PMR3_9BACT|nr:UDP-4-amino-4,6-dideoxy-N-acetyl-beta-L-altrosamine transaminase [Marinitoga aeolica]WGS63895.1 UDP-4-amino-4,6-dideoxy-N-acetyl-beta-L-altrosamine transaminase [Marinitoga aeolica]
MKIPYGKQWIDEKDIKEVVKILENDWITQGPMVEKFEQKVAEYCGVKYAVAVNSGTAALHAAYFAAGLKSEDEIITSPITFTATSNAALYLGAKPIFCDIDIKTYCIDIEKIEEKITDKTKIITPVSYAGYPVNIDKIKEIADKYNLIVIEDAAHALGAIRNGKKVGIDADMTILSFHPVKHITTGEGGMILTNDEKYYEKLKLFRTHGITKDKNKMLKNDGAWYYEMHELGYNYRIPDILSALGYSQMDKLEMFIERRNYIAKRYNEAFRNNHKITIPPVVDNNSRHAYHLYPLLINDKNKRKYVFDRLREEGIYAQVHYIPVHLQPYYQKNLGYKKGDYPIAEDFYSKEISLPMYPKMTEEEINYVINTVDKILKEI